MSQTKLSAQLKGRFRFLSRKRRKPENDSKKRKSQIHVWFLKAIPKTVMFCCRW